MLTDMLTDAVGLVISVVRKITRGDRYVLAGLWKAKGDYTVHTHHAGWF